MDNEFNSYYYVCYWEVNQISSSIIILNPFSYKKMIEILTENGGCKQFEIQIISWKKISYNEYLEIKQVMEENAENKNLEKEKLSV